MGQLLTSFSQSRELKSVCLRDSIVDAFYNKIIKLFNFQVKQKRKQSKKEGKQMDVPEDDLEKVRIS